MNANLMNLANDLEKKQVEDYENNADNYIEGELTDQDRETIQELRAQTDTALMVTETGADGQPVSQPIQEFVKSIDDKKMQVDADRAIKTINSGDITRTVDEIKQQTRDRAIKSYRLLAGSSEEELSDDDIMDIHNRAIESLQKAYGLEHLTIEALGPRLKKTDLKTLCGLLPKEYVNIYLTDREILSNSFIAKNKLITAIEYLCVTGPEMDYLNQYIEDENKLALVSKRIMQCQLDFNEMLKDEKTMSELVARTVNMSKVDNGFWYRYIKFPNRVHNEFAQRYVIQEKYREAYEKLLEDYPVIQGDSLTQEQQHDNEVNEKARAVIQTEIDEADHKMQVYQSISDLNLIKELYPVLEERYMHGTKLTHKFLIKEGIAAVDRAKRCKQDVPFPGFNRTTSKPDQLYKSFLAAYVKMIENYNTTVSSALKKASEDQNLPDEDVFRNISTIELDGCDKTNTYKVFSTVVLILMGRILRKLVTHEFTKYDAIVVDSYFQIFCRLGTDLYLMSDIWEICKPLVAYIMNNIKFDQKW